MENWRSEVGDIGCVWVICSALHPAYSCGLGFRLHQVIVLVLQIQGCMILLKDRQDGVIFFRCFLLFFLSHGRSEVCGPVHVDLR